MWHEREPGARKVAARSRARFAGPTSRRVSAAMSSSVLWRRLGDRTVIAHASVTSLCRTGPWRTAIRATSSRPANSPTTNSTRKSADLARRCSRTATAPPRPPRRRRFHQRPPAQDQDPSSNTPGALSRARRAPSDLTDARVKPRPREENAESGSQDGLMKKEKSTAKAGTRPAVPACYVDAEQRENASFRGLPVLRVYLLRATRPPAEPEELQPRRHSHDCNVAY